MIGWVYVATNPSLEGLVKVGFSTNDPRKRMRELSQAGLPFDHRCVFWVMCNHPRDIEQRVHRHLREHRAAKEWFRLTPEEAAAAILHFVPNPIQKYCRDLPTEIKRVQEEQARLARVEAYEREQQQALQKIVDEERDIADWRACRAEEDALIAKGVSLPQPASEKLWMPLFCGLLGLGLGPAGVAAGAAAGAWLAGASANEKRRAELRSKIEAYAAKYPHRVKK